MEDLPKGLASSSASKIARRLRSVSGGKILDVATASGDFIDTLINTLKDYDSFVGIDHCASPDSKKAMESAEKRFEGMPARASPQFPRNLVPDEFLLPHLAQVISDGAASGARASAGTRTVYYVRKRVRL